MFGFSVIRRRAVAGIVCSFDKLACGAVIRVVELSNCRVFQSSSISLSVRLTIYPRRQNIKKTTGAYHTPVAICLFSRADRF